VPKAARTYPSVLSKVSAREATTADVKSAEWQRFPTPSLESDADRSGNNNVVFRLQQPLWTGGAITNGIALSKKRLEKSK